MMKRLLVFMLATGCATSQHMRKTEEDGEAMRFNLAETYVRKGAYSAAIPLLRREVAAQPRSAKVHTLYGVVLREQGLYPQAEKELKAALAIAPSSARTLDAIGVLYDLMHRSEEAEASHRAALEVAPGEAMFWNNLGFSLYIAKKNEDAIVALERALALDPGLIVAYDNLGFAYGRRGDDASAERCFRTVGGELGQRVNMAIIYEQRGDADGATRLRADARALDPKVELEAQ